MFVKALYSPFPRFHDNINTPLLSYYFHSIVILQIKNTVLLETVTGPNAETISYKIDTTLNCFSMISCKWTQLSNDQNLTFILLNNIVLKKTFDKK